MTLLKMKIDSEKFGDLKTPAIALPPLIRALKKAKINYATIWEPTDFGDSEITKALKAAGYKVISSDIKTGVDFLQTGLYPCDMIITNPPYDLKDDFLERCFQFGLPFALLLPLTAQEGIRRGKLFRKYGISVIVLDRRLDFTGKGACWFPTAWFLYKIGQNNRLTFEEVKK